MLGSITGYRGSYRPPLGVGQKSQNVLWGSMDTAGGGFEKSIFVAACVCLQPGIAQKFHISGVAKKGDISCSSK